MNEIISHVLAEKRRSFQVLRYCGRHDDSLCIFCIASLNKSVSLAYSSEQSGNKVCQFVSDVSCILLVAIYTHLPLTHKTF